MSGVFFIGVLNEPLQLWCIGASLDEVAAVSHLVPRQLLRLVDLDRTRLDQLKASRTAQDLSLREHRFTQVNPI